MPLYLREAEVDALLSPAAAVEAVEGCFARLAAGEVDVVPRSRLPLDGGALSSMAAVDRALGVAAAKIYTGFRDGLAVVLALFAADRPELLALIEADRLGALRTGAASAVAARRLAIPSATTLGLIGTGRQSAAQLECLREVLPGLRRVVAYSRDPARLAAFCRQTGAEQGEYNREAAEQEIVVTATTSRDPVLRGEWLQPGALVCAIGANRLAARELDNVVVERARFVCCDLKEQARLEAGDLVEPVERGVLDWLEVHELAEVVAGEVPGRAADDDIVLFKSVGIAAEDVAVAHAVYEVARSQAVGVEL